MERELKRLRGLEEPESRLKMNQVEFLQDQARQLAEHCKKLKNEKFFLKDNVALLGQVAELMLQMILVTGHYSDQEIEHGDELEMLRLRKNVVSLGAASQLMFDMTLLMAQVSAQN